jgi:hypothetical protein
MESILRDIIGQIHVSKPLDYVIGTCKARLKSGAWESMTKKEQNKFIAIIKKIRKNDVDLYKYVMGGMR